MKRCSKHPKYNGRKKPKFECMDCLNFWLNMSKKPRFGIKRTKVQKDKTKYNRKEKYKK